MELSPNSEVELPPEPATMAHKEGRKSVQEATRVLVHWGTSGQLRQSSRLRGRVSKGGCTHSAVYLGLGRIKSRHWQGREEVEDIESSR